MRGCVAPAGAFPPEPGTKMTRSNPNGLSLARRLAAAGLCGVAALSLSACGHGKKKEEVHDVPLAPSQTTTLGVNSYLWRASLDSVSFMPLLQSDSNGGVIITDWYTNPKNPGERMKVSIAVLSDDLRADALRVTAVRETQQGSNWVQAPVQAATVQKLEEVILTRARDLRRNTITTGAAGGVGSGG